MDYTIYYIFSKKDDILSGDFFMTKNKLTKAIYGLKHCKIESKIKSILHQSKNNYIILIYNIYKNVTRPFMLTELEKVKNLFIKEKPVIKYHREYLFCRYRMTTKQIFGRDNEIIGFNLINKHLIFNFEIEKSKYKWNEFDFFKNGYMFEFKSYSHSINHHRDILMNASKLLYDNMVFIYFYNGKYYYHLYDTNYNYNTKWIECKKELGSPMSIECIIIPRDKVFEIDFEKTKINLPVVKINENYEYLVWKDKNRYLLDEMLVLNHI